MLMMTRRAGQKIVLGDGIVIEVVEVAGNTVRLGVDAPRSVPVYREELWTAVRLRAGGAGENGAARAPPRLVAADAAAGARRAAGVVALRYSAVSPSTIRSVASAAASTSARTSPSLWRQRPRTWAATMSGSVESGRPTPTRTRAKSAAPRPWRTDFRPLWPARPPPRRLRISPNGRSISSWTRRTRSRSTCSAPRAGPTERPASFMYV